MMESSRADAAYASDSTAFLHSKKHNQVMKTVDMVALARAGFTSTHATLEVAKPTCDVTQASAGFVSRPVPPTDCVSQPASKNRVNANPFPPPAILPSLQGSSHIRGGFSTSFNLSISSSRGHGISSIITFTVGMMKPNLPIPIELVSYTAHH
ncbi:uncharacterized protein G2W53_037198 [Senna tora]|uniref:Uncharacterized protein n=1 Tax=Senna tora TaxID=362788 RepID=A0A834W5H1_9FABA|nr:uncharacterized protein G2W53_037198 [Senna tora]